MGYSAVGCIMMLTLSLLTAPLAAQAQSVAKTPRIGYLTPTFGPNPSPAFRQGLRDLGYIEGQSIVLESRFAEGRSERLPELAAELVRLKVDVIVANGAQAVRAAQHATGGTTPIVFPAVSDPVGQGLVASLARPGGNITGLSFNDPELIGKRLELLKEAMPGVIRVAYLWHVTGNSARFLQETERSARALGVQLQAVEVRDFDTFDQAFAAMAEAHTDALITMPSAEFLSRPTQIVDLAAKTRLPGIFPDRGLAAFASS